MLFIDILFITNGTTFFFDYTCSAMHTCYRTEFIHSCSKHAVFCFFFRNIQESSGIHHDPFRDWHSQALPHTHVIGSAPGSTRADLGFSQPHNPRHADQGGALHRIGTNWCCTGKLKVFIPFMNNPQWLPHSLLMNGFKKRNRKEL